MYTFSEGQLVTWAQEAQDCKSLIAFAQEAPFEIVKLELVDARCTCGLDGLLKVYPNQRGEHNPECGVNNVKKLGHPQWVFIKTSAGEKRFSGGFFAPVEVS